MGSKLKVALVVLAGATAGVVAVWKLAPDRRTAEQQILDTLVEIQAAVEDKSVRGCLKHVSEEYTDSEAQSKRGLQQLAIAAFREPGTFAVVLQPKAPVVNGAEAAVDVRVDFSIARGQSVSRAEPFTVHTRWAKEGRRWRVVSASGYMEGRDAFEKMP